MKLEATCDVRGGRCRTRQDKVPANPFDPSGIVNVPRVHVPACACVLMCVGGCGGWILEEVTETDM